MIYLGIDAGGSATRWSLCTAQGDQQAAGELPSVSGHLFDPAHAANFRNVFTTLAARLPPVAGILAGVAGLTANTQEAETAATLLATAFAIPATSVQIHDDLWIAYHAIFRPGEGHLIYCGTGSIGLHIPADGHPIRVGGRGALIDDAGSAYWIGRQALNHVWRERDTDPAYSSPLANALATQIGADDWPSTRRHAYGGGRSAIAALARTVATTNDPAALAILHQAGEELARLARALAHRAGNKPIALAGRAAALHPAILAALRTAAPSLSCTLVTIDAARAAARLAARRSRQESRRQAHGP